MKEFKVGDKVRNVRDTKFTSVTLDLVYTVAAIRKEPRWGMQMVQFQELQLAFPYHWRESKFYALEVAAPEELDLLAAITGTPLKFRSGCEVKFVAYVKDAKPHCQLVLLNPATGNVVTRYANGKSSTETHGEPGDILVVK